MWGHGALIFSEFILVTLNNDHRKRKIGQRDQCRNSSFARAKTPSAQSSLWEWDQQSERPVGVILCKILLPIHLGAMHVMWRYNARVIYVWWAWQIWSVCSYLGEWQLVLFKHATIMKLCVNLIFENSFCGFEFMIWSIWPSTTSKRSKMGMESVWPTTRVW